MRTIDPIRVGDRNWYVDAAPPAPRKATTSPLLHFEYAYYFAIFYAYIGPTVGITIPYLPTIFILGLTGLCILRRRSSLWMIYRPVFRPILCILSFVAIQYFVYGEGMPSLMSFWVWAASIIIIQSLFIREGFLHRFSFVMFAIGISLLPFMDLRPGEGAQRAGLATSSVLANPNSLGAWFGFCAVYFLIRALQRPRLLDRLVSGALTFLSLLIVSLTVSRSTLIGVALAVVVGLRKQLKRGFIPILLAVAIAGAGFAFGVFDNAIGHYVDRGTEEAGRTGVLPYAFQRFIESPLTGVGVSNIGTTIPGAEGPTDPHNALLFFALASGIVPLFLLLAYWMSAFKGAFHVSLHHPYSAYLMPLLVYCSINLIFNDTIYMFPWFIAVLSACLIRSPKQGSSRFSQWEFR